MVNRTHVYLDKLKLTLGCIKLYTIRINQHELEENSSLECPSSFKYYLRYLPEPDEYTLCATTAIT